MLTTSHLDRQVFVYLAMPFAVLYVHQEVCFMEISHLTGFDYPRTRALIMGFMWIINKCLVTNLKLHNATLSNL